MQPHPPASSTTGARDPLDRARAPRILALVLGAALLASCTPRVQPPDWLVAEELSAVNGTQAVVPALPGFGGGCFWPFVNLYTGELFASYRAVAAPAAGWPWDLRLYYNSALAAENSAFGLGWRHSYDIRLVIAGDLSTIEVTWGDGRRDLFTQNGPAWDAAPSLEGRRITPSGGGYELRTKHGLAYQFDTSGKLTALVDRNANTMTFAYDGLDRLVTITDAPGRSLSLAYDAQDHVVQIAGFITQPLQFVYSGNLLADVVDPGGFPYHYEYDALDRLVRARDGAARDVDFVYYPPPFAPVVREAAGSGALRRYEYDGLNRLTTVRDRISATEERSAHYRFDPLGRCIEVQDEELQTASTLYDPVTNKIASHTDADGQTTTRTYDALGNLVTESYADGSQIAFTYHPTYNFPATYQRRSGGTTTYSYDANGNMISRIDPVGGQVLFTFTPRGEVASVQDERGFVTQYAYDAFGHMIQTTDPAGNTRDASYDNEGALLSVRDRTGNFWTVSQNARHEAVALTEPGGGVHQYAYTASGRLASRQDPSGAVTTYSYDGLDRLIRTQDPTGGALDLTRDGAGRVVEERDALGQVLRYVRDGVGRIVQRIHPGGQTWQYFWGPCDLLTAIDAMGVTTTYQYDAVHRLIQRNATGVSATYGYDSGSRLVLARLSFPPEPDVIHTYTYDAMDRRIGSTQQPLNRGVVWSRNLHGDVQTAGDNLRPGAVTWAYDNRERTSVVTTIGPAFQASIAYDQEERVTQLAYTNGVNATYAYDINGRIRMIRDQSPFYNAFYDPIIRNGRGNVIHMDVSTPALALGPHDFAFDPNGNVVNEIVGGAARLYQYDLRNNRIFKNGPSGPEPYVLSPDHWILTAGGLTQTWNQNGQVIQTTRPGLSVNYIYRSDRRLSQMFVNGQPYGVIVGPLDEIAKVRFPGGQESWLGYDLSGGSVLRRSVHTAVNVPPSEEFVFVPRDLSNRGTASAPVLSLRSPFVAANRGAILVGPVGVSRVTDGAGAIVGAKDFTAFGEVVGTVGAASLPSFGGMDHVLGVDGLFLGMANYNSAAGGSSDPPPGGSDTPFQPLTGAFLYDRSFGPDVTPGGFDNATPSIFSPGIVGDPAPYRPCFGGPDLEFQTDGPIICQALFQRLAPREPRYGAGINYAGDRLEVYFDPAYTVTQGGIIFGSTPGGSGSGGTILVPAEPAPSGAAPEPSADPSPFLPFWEGYGWPGLGGSQEWLQKNSY